MAPSCPASELAGADSLTGPPTDLSVDGVGADADSCQGPGLDLDVLTACDP
jgi:hypothetical protein